MEKVIEAGGTGTKAKRAALGEDDDPDLELNPLAVFRLKQEEENKHKAAKAEKEAKSKAKAQATATAKAKAKAAAGGSAEGGSHDDDAHPRKNKLDILGIHIKDTAPRPQQEHVENSINLKTLDAKIAQKNEQAMAAMMAESAAAVQAPEE